MGDMRTFFEPYKESHKQRVAKTPQRLEYAVKLLKENGIDFRVCNEATGQINCFVAYGKVLTFYAGTGKIQGYKDRRGIHCFVNMCKSYQKFERRVRTDER